MWRNGELEDYIQWRDEEGDIINASDGGIIYVEGIYYWYGMALRGLPFASGGKGGQTTTQGVVMYSSVDLEHWKKEGIILPCTSEPESELYGPLRFERPKIIYNEKTGQYVLWCHYVKYPGDHGITEGTAEAGRAVCDRVNGTYEWKGCCRPIAAEGAVKDCTLYKDRDGSAYFIYDRRVGEERCLHAVRLSDDYLNAMEEYQQLDAMVGREAPAVVYQDGYYFMITSGLSGWTYNQAKYFRAKRIFGPWEDMGDPCVGDTDHTTFHSQSSYIFRVEGKENLYIHMAERHNTENFEHCSYVWLPVTFHPDHTLSLHYQKEVFV